MNTATGSTEAQSVVLISPAAGSQGSNGSGFIVARSGSTATVVTCSHVIAHADDPSKVLVNGRTPTSVAAASDIGLDLALLEVPDLPGPSLKIGSLRGRPDRLAFIGFSKLHLDDYVRRRREVSLVRSIDVQHGRAVQSFLAYEVSGENGEVIVEPGHSGSPLIFDHTAIGVLTHRLDGGKQGLVVALERALSVWKGGQHLVATVPTAEEVSGFPELPPPPTADPEDDNAGRFGKATRDGLELSAELKYVDPSETYFVCDLVVRPTNGRTPPDEARFILHSSFSPRMFRVRRRKNAAKVRLADVTSYGSFTAGAQVRRGDKYLTLGYDLATTPGLPERLKEA